jgi:hypothetical protein
MKPTRNARVTAAGASEVDPLAAMAASEPAQIGVIVEAAPRVWKGRAPKIT